jgi:thymidylate synthase ThyX
MHTDQSPISGEYTADEQVLLAPYVTSVEAPVFGLRNLPEVVKGALFSRYSRSEKSLRRILLDEFVRAPESGFADLVGSGAPGESQLVAVGRAEAFYDRVLVGYGDDSVAELGGAHLACEEISNIAAKALEDARIGLSPLEKSTRYVTFNQRIGGRYRYLREPTIMGSAYAGAYEAALDGLFDTYTALMEPTLAVVRANNPRDAQTSERAYASATRAKACDLLRGLLPMATLTNVGLFGNGRAFEYLITKLRATALRELHDLADSMQRALDLLIPSFVKRAKSERGQAYQEYLRRTRVQVAELVAELPIAGPAAPPADLSGYEPLVTLIDYDTDAEVRIVAAMIYAHSDLTLEDAYAAARRLEEQARNQLLQAYIGERGSRFHRPGRAFEEPRYVFDILADLGAYRDIQRHRMLTQERQRFGVQHGYIVPPELAEAGLADPYRAALEYAAETVQQIGAEFPDEAQYGVPLAFRARWRMTLNLREVYHLAELRSAPQGHPSYRRIAQQIYAAVHAVHPALAEGMRFISRHETALERLEAERRIDAKMKN